MAMHIERGGRGIRAGGGGLAEAGAGDSGVSVVLIRKDGT